MTTLQTFKAIVKGKAVIVNELYNGKTGEISYSVNGKQYEHDSYWQLNPERIKG